MIPTNIARKIFALTIIFTLSVLAAGCMNMNGGARQQGTPMNQQGNGVRQLGQARQPNIADNRIQVADKAAKNITRITGVRQANVLITQRNAYVAAVLDNNEGQLSRKIEDQIAQQVRAIDPNVENVYVSTNPDFVGRINTYVDDVQQGRPIAGFVEQFNEMVQRIFPNAR
jgi:spore cortex protein